MITTTVELPYGCLNGKISAVIKYLRTLPPDDTLRVEAEMDYGEPNLCIYKKASREETNQEFKWRKELADRVAAQNLTEKKELYEQLKKELGE